jgi:hypothetical protein
MNKLAALFILVILNACVSKPFVTSSTRAENEFTGNRYTSVLIVGYLEDANYRKDLETSLANTIKKEIPHISVYLANELIPGVPNVQSIQEIIAKNKIETVLFVKKTSHGLNKIGSATFGTITELTDNYYSYEATTYNRNQLSVSLEASLIDVEAKTKIWVNKSDIRATSASEVTQMFPAFGERIGSDLASSGFISQFYAREKRQVDPIPIEPTYQTATRREVSSVASKDEDFKLGFRTLKWGDSPIDGMNEVAPKGKFKGFAFTDENTNVYGINADLISYYFTDNKFVRFEIIWGFQKRLTSTEFGKLKKHLTKALGKPDKIDYFGGLRWKHKPSNTLVMLDRGNFTSPESEGHYVKLIVDVQ